MISEVQAYYVETVFNDMVFILYITTLAVDIVTGNIVAMYQRKWNSGTGINGSLRHLALASVMILLLPMITFTTNIPGISKSIVLYVIGQYTISILENLSALGLDITEPFAKYFEFLNPDDDDKKQLNKKGERNEDSESDKT